MRKDMEKNGRYEGQKRRGVHAWTALRPSHSARPRTPDTEHRSRLRVWLLSPDDASDALRPSADGSGSVAAMQAAHGVVAVLGWAAILPRDDRTASREQGLVECCPTVVRRCRKRRDLACCCLPDRHARPFERYNYAGG